MAAFTEADLGSAIAKMEFFVRLVNGSKSINIIIKTSILDTARVLLFASGLSHEGTIELPENILKEQIMTLILTKGQISPNLS